MNRITRREAVLAATAGAMFGVVRDARLDRRKIVERHNPVLTKPNINSALQVGNGEFAFAADITGLQTFPDEYAKGMPLGTMAQWAWHSFQNRADYRLAAAMKPYDSHGRRVYGVHCVAGKAAGFSSAGLKVSHSPEKC